MTISEKVKRYAINTLGFWSVGITRATRLEPEAFRLEQWLKNGMHGGMAYMAHNFEKRVDPRMHVPDAKSVLVVTANYSSKPLPLLGVARYAQGEDYHKVLNRKLQELFAYILSEVGSVNGRAFVDSAPLMEKALAVRAGLGWIGKNGNIISKRQGSYFFIGSLVLDCALEYDEELYPDHCGRCRACIDACPTRAIVSPSVVDARRCISYLTIEHKGEFNEQEKKDTRTQWIFGCDICQEVCPWNRFAPRPLPEFEPAFPSATREDILSMTKSSFKKTFGETALFRTGLRRLKRNILSSEENKHPLLKQD